MAKLPETQAWCPRPQQAAARRGGASTAARSSAPDPDAPTPTDDPLTQARADCWMKTETAKLRDVDARAAFVDKCVKDTMKNGPKVLRPLRGRSSNPPSPDGAKV